MTAATEQATRIDLNVLFGDNSEPLPLEGVDPQRFTAIVVNEGGQWASLCPELDIASVGSSPEDALAALVDAVRLAFDVSRRDGLEPGEATPPDAIRDFMVRTELPAQLTIFTL
jgi:predicted RNase H-like HicB family nuclease